jgi:sarcosine oxidase subunit gamma
VSELQLYPQTPQLEEFHGNWRPNRTAGVEVEQCKGLSLVLITARYGKRDACVRKLKAAYDFDPPGTAKITHGRDLSLLWHGLDSWLAVAPNKPDLESKLRTALGGLSSIVDLSDARIVLRINGAAVRPLLAKGLSIDLHPRIFKPGDTAMTMLSHVAIHIWQIDECPTFDVAIPRATARDFFHWLTVSAAEFGLAIRRTQLSTYKARGPPRSLIVR